MIHKIKTLGLTFVAVIAVSGVRASGAQAGTELHIRSPNSTIITAEPLQQHLLRIGTWEFRCPEATLEGRIPGSGSGGQTTIADAVLTPTYGSCQSTEEGKIGQIAATVQMNGCKFRMNGSAVTALRYLFQVTGCTIGKKIVVANVLCQIQIGEQGELEHVVFSNRENAPNPEDVDANLTVSGIAISKSGTCPTAQQASLSGETTVRAYVDNGDQTETSMGHQYTKSNCGSEVGIFST